MSEGFSPVTVALAAFLHHATAFGIAYPTVEFLSWGKDLKHGRIPQVPERKLRMIRAIVLWELAGLLVMILCAALMARGIGVFG